LSPTSPDLAPALRLSTLPEELPDLTLGWEAVRWASKYLRQPNGPRAGQRFEFVPSQVRWLLHWYAVDGNGDWLYRRGVRRLAKGSGKSPNAAVMALVELCAPVRLRDFDPSKPGGCLGRQVSMPLVQIAAAVESQTENTMRMVRAFAPRGSRVVADHGLDPGLTQFYKAGGGKLHILTSSPRAAEGGEATFVVADEPEHWLPSNGGPELASTLADNLAKSGSRMVETCNSWEPGIGSVAEASWDTWVAQEEGRGINQSRMLYDARVAPPNTVLDDSPRNCERDGFCSHDVDEPHLAEIGLSEGLEWVYGDCWWALQQLPSIRERIWDRQAKVHDSRRKYLNQPTASEDAWVSPQEWAKLADPTRVVADGEDVVLFFDGSKSRDATALIGCCMSDGHVFTVGVWEPDSAHDTTSTVDVEAVDSAVEATFARLNVLAFFADVKEWEGFAKVTWPDRYKDRLQMWASPSGREPALIAWDMRSHSHDFAEAAELCLDDIVEGRFSHDGDSRVTRHVGNARAKGYRGRTTVGKESPDSPRKVDAAVCVIGARMVRRLAIAQGITAQEPNEAVFF
jgi:hypothetical protein